MSVRHSSPLRYPGGKSGLFDFVKQVLTQNGIDRGHYAEPYAGGGGLALSLLFNGYVSEVHLNDIDIGVSSFWYSALHRTDELIDLVLNTPIDVSTWYMQREVLKGPASHSTLEIGFATFFLNRTNRSGIIKGAGIIGGLEQRGSYKMDCRFNRDELARRIRRIASYKSQIHFHQEDAVDFITSRCGVIGNNGIVYIDPPYYDKGSKLYTSFYRPEDHVAVSAAVLALDCPWMLTYDDVFDIEALYQSRRQFTLGINYSVQTKRTGSEILIVSDGLKIPTLSPDEGIRRQLVHLHPRKTTSSPIAPL